MVVVTVILVIMSIPGSVHFTPEQLASLQQQLLHANDDRRPEGLAWNTTFVVLATIAVLLRFASRKVAKAPYKSDDYMTVFGLVSYLSLLFAVIHALPFVLTKLLDSDSNALISWQVLVYALYLASVMSKYHCPAWPALG